MGHVRRCRIPRPPEIERAAAGKQLVAMLLDREIDAAIIGTELPNDPRIKPVITDPDAAAQAFVVRPSRARTYTAARN